MKTTVKFPLPQSSIINVTEGDSLSQNSILAKKGIKDDQIEINLSQILKVKPENIFRYLKKKPGDLISEREKIAEKKTLITSLSVKSPKAGKISEVDLKKGIVVISHSQSDAQESVRIPLSGKVKTVSKDYIELEVKGIKIKGITGSGPEVIGPILSFREPRSSIFDIDSQVDSCLVLIEDGTGDILTKLEVLGACGAVVIEELKDESVQLPFLVVSGEDHKEMKKYNGEKAWMRPALKEIIISADL